MKSFVATTAACIAAVVALVCTSSASAEAISAVEKTCLAGCQAEVMSFQAQECAPWRERLPRPDLYSLCQDGFDLGVSAGCKGYCSSVVNEEQLASLRLDACTFLRGTPPMDRMRSCQSGFSAAVQQAKHTTAVKTRSREREEPEAQDVHVHIPAVAASTDDSTPKKKPVSIKKAPDARNILELAREEAQAAFLDTRATDL